MNKAISGLILLILGVLALVVVHSLRPPDGLGEAFVRMVQGKDNYIKEPFYQIFMSMSAIVAFAGGAIFVVGLAKGKSRS